MKVPFLDSYGLREPTIREKWLTYYKKARLLLFDGTDGLIKYSPYQANHFVVEKGHIEKLKQLFLDRNRIDEFISPQMKELLVKKATQKSYLFNVFQRVFFLQQFYNLHSL
jgi:hypothetical protein